MADKTEVKKTREEVLAESLEARDQEIMYYQINIDNYTLALERIDSLPTEERRELSAFADQLSSLLASEKLEQKKAKIMQAVVQQQLNQ